MTGQALTYPLDRARAVMAVTKVGEYRNIFHVFSTIFNREGLLGNYLGVLCAQSIMTFYFLQSFKNILVYCHLRQSFGVPKYSLASIALYGVF